MLKCSTIGFFDGMHSGHQYVLKQLVEVARKSQLSPQVITFSQHPNEILKGMPPKRLTNNRERDSLIHVPIVIYNFENVYKMTAEEFMREISEKSETEILLMGYNQRFGCDQPPHFEDYVEIGRRAGVEVRQLTEFTNGGRPVSSTIIRNMITNGEFNEALPLLGHDYIIIGKVIQGRHIGRKIGYPTANLQVSPDKLLPQNGVYSASAVTEDKKEYKAIVNIGYNPTINKNTERTVEAYLIGFNGNLYEQDMTLSLNKFIRKEEKFANLEDLKTQIGQDIEVL